VELTALCLLVRAEDLEAEDRQRFPELYYEEAEQGQIDADERSKVCRVAVVGGAFDGGVGAGMGLGINGPTMDASGAGGGAGNAGYMDMAQVEEAAGPGPLAEVPDATRRVVEARVEAICARRLHERERRRTRRQRNTRALLQSAHGGFRQDLGTQQQAMAVGGGGGDSDGGVTTTEIALALNDEQIYKQREKGRPGTANRLAVLNDKVSGLQV
jgi:hypothetical protein